MGAFKIYNTTTSQWEYAKTVPANSTLVNGATLTGNIDGTNATFTTPTPFVFINVYKNGVRMRSGSGNDYTISGNNTIVFATAPSTGSILTVDYGTQQEQMINGSNSTLSDEVPTGAVNGTNKLYTTARAYVSGSLEVWINGIKQQRGVHFVETSNTAGTFTMDDAPLTGDNILVAYQFVISVSGNADTVDGYHVNATPTANQIPVLNANGVMPTAALGGAWTSWTPTFTNLSGGTLNHARYTQIGKTVHFSLKYTLAGANVSGAVSLTAPVTAHSSMVGDDIRTANINGLLLSAGNVNVSAAGWLPTATSILIRPVGINGSFTSVVTNTSATGPFTWKSGDIISISGTYEAA